jgi:superfamily I DNA/RNA helicase
MRPTPEQEQAADLYRTGNDLVIQAGAGTGKTTTLKLIAQADATRAGVYLAFNKAIAQEAGRAMPMGVQSTTMHSLAYRMAGDALNARERLNQPRQHSNTLAKLMGLNTRLVVTLPDGAKRVLQKGWQASHVMRAVTNFCQSADTEPTWRHFPKVPNLDPAKADGTRSWFNNRSLAMELEPKLVDAWDDLTNPNGRLRFTHDVYLKAAELAEVEMPGAYLMVDEAQDLNPVMLSWLAVQASAGKQLVFVGDSQQQIYDWRGAVDAMTVATAGGTAQCFLSQSFRFGQPIADVANAILGRLESELRLTGTPSVQSRLARLPAPDAVLCRSNAQAVHQLLYLQRLGLQPFLVGGSREITEFAHATIALMAGRTTSHPELSCFSSWSEVLDYVDQDPQGGDLRTMVRMVDDYGPQIVLDAVAGLTGEDGADVVVSTAHKAKGREWPRVRLAADFAEVARGDGTVPTSEWRLLYVACTRAQNELDISWATPVRELLRKPAPHPPIGAPA